MFLYCLHDKKAAKNKTAAVENVDQSHNVVTGNCPGKRYWTSQTED